MIVSKTAFSQDYMNDMTLKACECLNSISDTLDSDRYNLAIGLCLIDAAMPYQKQLMKDYKINLNKIEQCGEELGILLGLKMATVCPESVLKMTKKATKDNNKIPKKIIEGKIIGIDDAKFVEFSVKDDSGKISRYCWFSYIESNLDLSNKYKTLVGETVQITYIPQDFFDARISEYRTFNVIQKIETIRK